MRQDVQEVEWLTSMNLIVRKDVFEEVGGFNENLVTCEDVDLCYRIGQTHKIISDKRIKSIHQGEARTINGFFKKERWRGKSNLDGIKEHGLKLKEIPSVVLPIYYLVSPCIFLWVLFAKGVIVATAGIAILIAFPPLLISLRVVSKSKKYKYYFKASIIYFVYFIARASALIS